MRRRMSFLVAVSFGVGLALVPLNPAVAQKLGELTQHPGVPGCWAEMATLANACTDGNALDGAFGSTVSPDGKNVYVAASESDAIVAFDRSQASGELDQVQCVSETGTGGTCDNGKALDRISVLRISPDGANLYGVGQLSNSVVIFSIDPESGEITQLPGLDGCWSDDGTDGTGESCHDGKGLKNARDVVVSPDGRNVYVVSELSEAVLTFSRNPATGALTQIDCIRDDADSPENAADCPTTARAIQSPRGIAISPNGLQIYVTAQFDESVAVFDRNLATGLLTQSTGLDGCIAETGTSHVPPCTDGKALVAALGITVSPSGGNVYVTSRQNVLTRRGNAVAVLQRNAASGDLSQDGGLDGCWSETGLAGTSDTCHDGKALRQPFTVVVSQDGLNVYVAARNSDAIAVFDREAEDGSLVQSAAADPSGCISELAMPTGGAVGDTCNDGHALDDAAGVSISTDGENVYVAAGIASTSSDAAVILDRQK